MPLLFNGLMFLILNARITDLRGDSTSRFVDVKADIRELRDDLRTFNSKLDTLTGKVVDLEPRRSNRRQARNLAAMKRASPVPAVLFER